MQESRYALAASFRSSSIQPSSSCRHLFSSDDVQEVLVRSKPISCCAHDLYQPRFPEMTRGLSVSPWWSSARSVSPPTTRRYGHTTRPTFPFLPWLPALRHAL